MMSRRTTLGLLGVALALFGFILFFERDMLGSRDVAERGARLLPRFVSKHASQVDISRGDEQLSLRRGEATDDTEADEDDAAPPRHAWSLTAPVAGAADANAVASLLGVLEWAEPSLRIEDVSADDRARFGLDEPAIEARFRVADEEVHLRVGGEAPTGTGYYASTDEEGVAFVIGRDVYEALTTDLSALRSKELFGDALPNPDRLTVNGAQGRFVVVKKGSGYALAEPVAILASRAKVDAAVDALRGLAATRFVDEEVASDASTGLEDPWLRVDLRRGEGAARVLRVGAACGDHRGERYARLDEGALVCVAEAGLAPLLVSADALRDLRAVTASDLDVTGLTLDAGADRLEVKRSDDQLEYTIRRGGETTTGEATDEAFSAYVQAFRDVVALDAVALREGDAARYGLDRPRATLRVKLGEGRGEERLAVGDATVAGLYIRRGDEPFALRLPASAEPLFTPATFRLRDLRLLDAEPARLTRIEIQGAGDRPSEDLSVVGGAWRLVGPISAPADAARAADLARRLAALEAERFVADAPVAAHGLERPRFIVTAHFAAAPADDHDHDHGEADHAEGADEGPATHVLRVGAATEGGAYATLDDAPTVFVLPEAIVSLLARPLVDPRTLSTSATAIEAVRIERGGKTVAVRRDAARYVSDDGPADAERTRSLLDHLSSIVASGVAGYGQAGAATGLAHPRARLEITRAEGVDGPRTVTLLIGAERATGDARVVYVRRDDVDVTFEVPRELVDAVLAYEP